MEELISISFAIIYFDEALLALMPQHRRNSYYLRSNLADNDRFSEQSMNGCWTALLGLKTKGDFFDLMQNGDDECRFAWNFANLMPGIDTTGATIEWRQPPGVTTVDDCLGWTELAVEFIHAAKGWRDIGTEVEGLYAGDVDGLKEFLGERGQYPGSDMGLLDGIFRGKAGRVSAATQRVDYPADYDNGLWQ